MKAARFYEWRTPGPAFLYKNRDTSSKGSIGFSAPAWMVRGLGSRLYGRSRNVMLPRFPCSTELTALDYALKFISGRLKCMTSRRNGQKDGPNKKCRAFTALRCSLRGNVNLPRDNPT